MRSQALFRRSRSWLKTSSTYVYSAARPGRPPRKDAAVSSQSNAHVTRRLASSNILTVPIDPNAPPPPESDPSEPPQDETTDKPKRRTTKAIKDAESSKDADGISQLPPGLDILWTPEANSTEPVSSRSSSLPPPEVFEEALTNLHITLHPKSQHRATYTTPAGPPLEPTLALYCPIEGGEYIIDSTVHELARRTNAEIIVLDSVQLAAGEWGHFGNAANSLQLPRNPLHFPTFPSFTQSAPTPPPWADNEESGSTQGTQQTAPLTLAIVGPAGVRGRAYISSSPRSNSAPNKAKTFFDEIVNLPSKIAPGRPRIVYIRDFPTLAPSSSVWYPPLLSAVRQRRQGAMSRPSSPVHNPMTIVFGITPPITLPTSNSSLGGGGLMGLLLNRNQSTSLASSGSKLEKSEWAEDEHSEKAREKRLRDRLRKWERGDSSLQDELPALSLEDADESNSQRPEILVFGSPGSGSSLPSSLTSTIAVRTPGGRSSSEQDGNARFFRMSVLVPAVRSVALERACRVARRKEINELTMRMGVGSVGGTLAARNVSEQKLESQTRATVKEGEAAAPTEETMMWDDWGDRIEDWANVKRIADRAVGAVVAVSTTSSKSEKSTLTPTTIPWNAIHRAWAAQQVSRDIRKAWVKESSGKPQREQTEESGEKDKESAEAVDEVVERVKQDPDIDQHEQRLLPCIVDTASMTTSFNHVHLPPHTIDSVRTIVSLPLLHPEAFSQGILKEHGMTGCLLFGPPGTGKTLVVRALAKEAGCRMLAVSPSDVMDMYVGEGEKLVKSVFSLARKLSPCVVFLDEIDALFGARMSTRESGGAFAHRGVITEFMQELDGLKSSKDDGVVVIGATNRPFDLDDAVLRRLPRRLLVDLPGEKEREAILKILLRDEVLAPDLNLKDLAKKTETFSGSDLKHLCVSAALDAVKENVEVPWNLKASVASESTDPSPTTGEKSDDDLLTISRILSLRHFMKALKEITPSSSESLGTLADLRKWNEEFGEGRKQRRQQVWGKDRFGFTNKGQQAGEEGRVGVTR